MKRQYLLELLEGYHGPISMRRRGGPFAESEEVLVQVGEVIYEIVGVTGAEGDTFDADGNPIEMRLGGIALIHVQPAGWRLEEETDDSEDD